MAAKRPAWAKIGQTVVLEEVEGDHSILVDVVAVEEKTIRLRQRAPKRGMRRDVEFTEYVYNLHTRRARDLLDSRFSSYGELKYTVLDPESEGSKAVVLAAAVNGEIRALSRMMSSSVVPDQYTDAEYAAMAAVLTRALALVTTKTVPATTPDEEAKA